MNVADQHNAFGGIPAKPPRHEGGMQYLRSYQYVFDNPNWGTNLLLATVCQLIPIVGPIVMLGYQFDAIEKLHKNPRNHYADFTFDEFVPYMTRGIWPFLVALVASLIVVPFAMVLMFVFMAITSGLSVAAGGAGGGEETAAAVMLISMPLMMLAWMLMLGLMYVVMIPMILRAGLSQDFGQGFNFGFIRDFIGRVWKEMILSILFMMFSSMIVILLGMLLCFFGVYPANTLVQYASMHLGYQLYELYLQRGGEPIPLKQNIPPAAFA